MPSTRIKTTKTASNRGGMHFDSMAIFLWYLFEKKTPPGVSTLVGNGYFFVNWPANVLLSRPHTKPAFCFKKLLLLVPLLSMYLLLLVVLVTWSFLCRGNLNVFLKANHLGVSQLLFGFDRNQVFLFRGLSTHLLSFFSCRKFMHICMNCNNWREFKLKGETIVYSNISMAHLNHWTVKKLVLRLIFLARQITFTIFMDN